MINSEFLAMAMESVMGPSVFTVFPSLLIFSYSFINNRCLD